MAGRIPPGFIDELIARTDLVELIGSRVQLKKAGREWKACCPFHNEKTASFWVSPEKQFYHCFGCQAHGSALGFLMAYDRLSFPEAVEDLAERLGLEVPHEADARRPGTPTREPAAVDTRALYDVMAKAATWFQKQLADKPEALQYAARRGLNTAAIERFALGYAPAAWNELLQELGGNDRARQQLLATGLIIEREGETGRYYDRFRHRLMFPIRDTRGRVVGFGGRVLDDSEPKYLNSPETALFRKGQELYGLYETRLARTPIQRLIVVEGYMDVVALHQAGVVEAVATLGTATTVEHLRRAFRLVNQLVFAFDGDKAGRSAAWRALNVALPELRPGREVRFLFLPQGEDPDSLILRQGRAGFERCLEQALPLSEYLANSLSEQVDMSHADGQARFIALAQPLIARVAPGVFRDLLIERIATQMRRPTEQVAHWLGGPAPAADTDSSALAAAAPARSTARIRSAGRGGLITQAIVQLLHFPMAAAQIPAAQRQALASLNIPGIPVLCELLQQLSATPDASLGRTLESWRERPEFGRLNQLAAEPSLAPDLEAATQELRSAIERLLEEAPRLRADALIEKARTSTLTEQEMLEFQSVMNDSTRGGGRGTGGRDNNS